MSSASHPDDVHVTPTRGSHARGDNTKPQFTALVGKGVCFDAGGMNLKPTGHIEDMQLDKGGAAAVISAMDTLARMNAPVNVVGVIPAVENMVDNQSYKPGSIVKSCDVSDGREGDV